MFVSRLAVAIVTACVLCGALWADSREVREFSVLINGKDSGVCSMDIHTQDSGQTYVVGKANVRFQGLIISYTFQVETSEWWKNGQLIGLKSQCNDNGKRVEMTVSSDQNQLRLRVNGQQERVIRPESWASSFWKLPDARYHNKQIPILDSDTGKDYIGQLQYVGAEGVTIQGQPKNCYRFRVTGGNYPIDCWYDEFHRLVRQEFTESGHKTVVHLINIRR